MQPVVDDIGHRFERVKLKGVETDASITELIVLIVLVTYVIFV